MRHSAQAGMTADVIGMSGDVLLTALPTQLQVIRFQVQIGLQQQDGIVFLGKAPQLLDRGLRLLFHPGSCVSSSEAGEVLLSVAVQPRGLRICPGRTLVQFLDEEGIAKIMPGELVGGIQGDCLLIALKSVIPSADCVQCGTFVVVDDLVDEARLEDLVEQLHGKLEIAGIILCVSPFEEFGPVRGPLAPALGGYLVQQGYHVLMNR